MPIKPENSLPGYASSKIQSSCALPRAKTGMRTLPPLVTQSQTFLRKSIRNKAYQYVSNKIQSSCALPKAKTGMRTLPPLETQS